MKTIVNENNEKIVVAETTQEAMEMFRKALAKRKQIVNDDGEDRAFYNREEHDFRSFKNNKDFYDYGID